VRDPKEESGVSNDHRQSFDIEADGDIEVHADSEVARHVFARLIGSLHPGSLYTGTIAALVIAAVITAELYASIVGLGFLLNESGSQYKTARVFLQKGPNALSASKKLINRTMETSLATGCMHEGKLFAESFGTDEQIEGMSAFLERRKPDFDISES
jgi:enoyl-CoA hydratase/carnithine racemase